MFNFLGICVQSYSKTLSDVYSSQVYMDMKLLLTTQKVQLFNCNIFEHFFLFSITDASDNIESMVMCFLSYISNFTMEMYEELYDLKTTMIVDLTVCV